MPDKEHYFGGGSVESVINPIVLVAMLIAIVLILSMKRQYVVVPVFLMIFLVPVGQSIYAGGVHWIVGRIIILVSLFRFKVLRGSSKDSALGGGFSSIDKVFLGCVICQAIGFMLQYMESGAIVNQFGVVIDCLGGYFVVRALIHDEADIYRTLKLVAYISLILAFGMVWEQVHLQNVFGLLGGTQSVPSIREGKIRSQGVFQHALTAGVFGATLLPMFFLLWKNGRSKIAGATGMFACTVITICSNSSTPLLAYVAGIAGVCLWPIRKNMQQIRRGLVVVLVALQMVMSAPVWFLIARIDLTGGSSGYHRAELVDQFIRHFSEWWLIGTKDAGSWGYDLWDQQNQYVSVGETGGLAALVLFIAMISKSCARIGSARKLVVSKNDQWVFWFLGSAVFSNLVGFFGVNYFDQSKMAWYMLIAIIIAATTPILQKPGLGVTSPPVPIAEADGWGTALTAGGDKGLWA